MEQLKQEQSQLDEVVYRHWKYVIEEIARVNEFTTALTQSDLIKAGEILKSAQKAMKDEYEITCPEIDFMADFANTHEDILGARMMGGGFGGCTLNLIKKGREAAFIEALNEAYLDQFNQEITPIQVNISDGVSLIKV